MAHRILFGRSVLGKRSPITSGWNKQRVVPKAMIAAFAVPNRALAGALCDQFAAVGPAKNDHGSKACRSLPIRDAVELGDQPCSVRRVIMITAAVIGRLNAGSAVEGIDLEATVIGQRNLA